VINQIVAAILIVNVLAFVFLLMRNQNLLFAIMGVSLVALLVLTVAKEYVVEWRDYQKQFIRMQIEKATDPEFIRELKAKPIKITQIWNSERGVADRCTTCHQAVNDPLFKEAPEPFRYHAGAREHDFSEIGCTSCHRGQGRATETKEAHGIDIPHWEYPMWELDMIEISCPECHKKEDLPSLRLTGEVTMEQFIALGKRIFNSQGTCKLCHRPAGGAPNLRNVAKRAEKRFKESRYKGKAQSAEEYLRESMVDPSAFVVEGYGRRGTKDTVSPMPDITKGTIALSGIEINAVISYLQSSSGVPVTVSLPSPEELMATAEEEEEMEIQVAEDAREALLKFGCATCHMHPLIEDGGEIGPDLTNLAKMAGKMKKGLSAEQYIIESILNPNAFIVDTENYEPDTMPGNFARRMTVAEFNMIIDAMMGRMEKKEEKE
jgi:hypothetical protein